MLADLTLSSCQIGRDDKDKLVRYVLLSLPMLYCSGYHLIDDSYINFLTICQIF